jgi:hypothetical protein
MFHFLLESLLPEFGHKMAIHVFNFQIAILTSKDIKSGTNYIDLYIFICLTSLTLCAFSN